LIKPVLGLTIVWSVLLTFIPAPPASSDGSTVSVSLVQVIGTSQWSPPSPDPTGLTYFATSRRLVVVDSEVDETKIFAGSNVFMSSVTGQLKRSFSTTSYSNEPTDVATDRRNNRLFVSDDNRDRIFTVKEGPDRRVGTRDDQVGLFSTASFGATDPEGLEFAKGSLFVSNGDDGSGDTTDVGVYRVKHGRNGKFDGAPPDGDDAVTFFNAAALGISDPEDIAYDPQTKNLFIVSRTETLIAEVTLDGDLVSMIDIAFTGIQEPAGIALAPGTNDASVQHIYLADRGIDNDIDQHENDGSIFEIALGGATDTDRPTAPTGLAVTRQSTGLALSWNDNAETDLAGYNVFRSNGTTSYRKVNRSILMASEFLDPWAPRGATSFYRVVAVDTSGNESSPTEVSGERGLIGAIGSTVRTRASVSELTIPRPPRATPGAVMIASIGVRGALRVGEPPGWELVELQRMGRRLVQAVYVKAVVGRNEPTSYTWTFPRTGAVAGAIVAYLGVDRRDPVDVSAGGVNPPASEIVAPSLTASIPMELLVGVFGSAIDALVTAPDGMLEQVASRVTRGARRLVVEISDEVLESAGATGDRVAAASRQGVNIGQSVILRPRS
jgi:hypothetical protein